MQWKHEKDGVPTEEYVVQRCGALLFSQNFGRLDNNERLRGPRRFGHIMC